MPKKKLAKMMSGTTFIASHMLGLELKKILMISEKTTTPRKINEPKMTKYFVTVA